MPSWEVHFDLLLADVGTFDPRLSGLHQQLRNAMTEGCGLVAAGQLGHAHPPTLQHLVFAGGDVEAEGGQTTDEVEVGESKVVLESVLLAKGKD